MNLTTHQLIYTLPHISFPFLIWIFSSINKLFLNTTSLYFCSFRNDQFSYHMCYIPIWFRDILILVCSLYAKKVCTRVRPYIYIYREMFKRDRGVARDLRDHDLYHWFSFDLVVYMLYILTSILSCLNSRVVYYILKISIMHTLIIPSFH